MHRDDVGRRGTPKDERDLAHDVARPERREDEGLAAFDAHDRDFARSDEVEPGRGRSPRRSAFRPFRRRASRSARPSAGRSSARTADKNGAGAHQVLHHAPATVRRQLDGDIGLAFGDGIERVFTTHEQDARPAGDDARRARRARQEGHLAEERAAGETSEQHAVFALDRAPTSSSPRATMYASAPPVPLR